MTLTPAYSRDYKSKKEVEEAFNGDIDFIIADFNHPYSGKPVTRSELRSSGEKEVGIRYNGLRKIVFLKV